MKRTVVWLSLTALLTGAVPAGTGGQHRIAGRERQVADTERAFARTMADRDYASFLSFLASDAIFIGERTYNSIWRLEPDGKWRIIFDKGCPPCDC